MRCQKKWTVKSRLFSIETCQTGVCEFSDADSDFRLVLNGVEYFFCRTCFCDFAEMVKAVDESDEAF